MKKEMKKMGIGKKIGLGLFTLGGLTALLAFASNGAKNEAASAASSILKRLLKLHMAAGTRIDSQLLANQLQQLKPADVKDLATLVATLQGWRDGSGSEAEITTALSPVLSRPAFATDYWRSILRLEPIANRI